ncbi:hypothetical protein EV361DRAFT_956683 [Lentinula raphanica]|nr:hypothetical protein EV361DRAFT_956683 [Lentinula raphanica]
MTLTLKIDGQNMTGYLRLVIFTLIGLLVALDYSLNTTHPFEDLRGLLQRAFAVISRH